MRQKATQRVHAIPPPQPGELDLALAALPHGVTVLDGAGHVVFSNDQFRDLFALHDVAPGGLLSDLLGHGTVITEGESDTVVALLGHARMTASHSAATLRHHLPDGRTLNITHTPLASGGSVQLYEDITDRLKEEARLLHLSGHDPLTGLATRTLFRERLAEAVRASLSARGQGALLILDLDGFKEINDTLGHAVGDRLLQGAAIRIKRHLRKTDIFARLGGDEFAIMLAEIDGADALALAERINAAIEHPFRLDGHQIYTGVSIGIALFGASATASEPAELLRHADIAMYRAKAEGRNTCRLFEAAMDTQMRDRRALERDLVAAMDLDQFSLQYQPQLDLASNQICGAEALLRWHHPERGRVPPDLFIEVAEKIGLIVPLGEWVMRTACAQAHAWSGLDIAVNVSPIQLRHPGFTDMLDRVLDETNLPPHRLEIEITEGVLLNNSERVMATLRSLLSRGVKIALDDFGTGYSNLAYLQKFPWSKLKIDQSFVKRLEEDFGSAAIVCSVLALGSGLGVRVIAEGVETERQFELLQQAKCNEIQGYWLGRPMDPDKFEEFRTAWAAKR